MSSSTIIKLCHGDDTRRVALNSVSFEELTSTARARFSLQSPLKLTYIDEDGDTITVASDAELVECIRSHVDRVPKLSVNGAAQKASQPQPPKAQPAPAAAPQNPFEEIFAELQSVPAKLLSAMKASPEAQAFATDLGVDLAAADDWQNVAAQVEASDKVKSKLEEFGKQFEEMMEAENNNNNDDEDADEQELPEHPAICDSCSQRIRGVRHKCLDCADFDFCSACLPRKDAEHNPAHSFLAIDRPASFGCFRRCKRTQQQQQQQQQQPTATPMAKARLVDDLTSAAVAVARGEQFTKVLVFENCGATAWRGLRLRWISGDRVGVPLVTRVAQEPVGAGERVHVVVDGKAPIDFVGDSIETRLQLIDQNNRAIADGDVNIKLAVV